MLELYNAAISTCSQRVRMALAEKQLEWTDRRISLRDGEHLTEQFLALNPDGLVPVLVHDGRAINDSSVIMEYLDDVFPDHPLRPSDPYELARVRAWRQYIDEVPTPATRIPSFHMSFANKLRKLPRPQLEAIAARRPLRKHMFLKIGPEGLPAELLKEADEQLTQTFSRLEAALALHPWVGGNNFTIADISVLPSVVRMEDLGFDHYFKDRSNVADWYRRIQERPSFAAAYYPESRDLRND
jgi:glutathione S-transferase